MADITGSQQTATPWLRRFLVFVMPFLVLTLAIILYSAMGALKPKPEEKTEDIKAVPVLTSLAQTKTVTLQVSAQGQTQPRTKIKLVPQVSGKIAYMSPQFIEGGKFNKGDLLIRIEDEDYKLRVVQAQANVAQAETAVTRELSEAEIAKSDWADLGQTTAPSALTLRKPQLAEAKAKLAAAKAALDEAQLQLRRTSLYAPFTGRVTSRAASQGAFVTTGSELGEIYAIDIMDVRLPLTQQDLARAGISLGYAAGKTPGIPVTLSANIAGTQAQWDAHIVRTDSGFDPATRVLFAYAELKDPFGAGAYKSSDAHVPLAPGLFVTAHISGQNLPDILTIPRAALRGKDQIYVVETDGVLSIKTVTVVSSDREQAVISSGLSAGDQVVTSPIRGAADGMKVEVVTRNDPIGGTQ